MCRIYTIQVIHRAGIISTSKHKLLIMKRESKDADCAYAEFRGKMP